jgi:3-oxoacyl-[acyl-carrier-protein] synthase III
MALEASGVDPRDVGLCVLATSTPDHLLPPSAPKVAHLLGLEQAGAVDMAGACAGFLYALVHADHYVRLWHKPALVIAANLLSRRINRNERASAVLFADAAGAVVLEPVAETGRGITGLDLASNGAHYGLVHIPAGGSCRPFGASVPVEDTLMALTGGRELFAQAVDMMAGCAARAMDGAGLPSAGIGYFVPHQANSRMFDLIAERLDVPPEKMLRSIALYGNSSAATIPLTLSLASQEKAFGQGEHLLMTAAGAGLTGGALVWRV